MRTIGPFLPSGRRSASTSSGGSLAGSDSSRRTSVDHGLGEGRGHLRLDAVDRLVHEHHVRVAAVGQLEAAVAAHRDDRDPGRRRRRGRAARARTPSAMSSVACSVASVSRLRPCPTTATSVPATSSPHAIRSSSRRRTARTAPTAASGVSARSTSACISASERLGAQRRERLPQHLHALRLALEQVGGVARGAEDVGQPLGDLALVAQHREVPRRAAQALADPPEAEQPGVGVGRVGEPLQQHRQQRPLDVGGARDPAGQRLEVAQRGLGVGVAEGGEPRLGGLERQPGLRRRGAWRRRRAAAGRRASRAAGAPRGGGSATACRAGRPARRRGRASGRAGAATPRPRAARGYAAAGGAGSGARACGGRRRPRAASRRPRGRRSRRRSARVSALRVAPSRSVGSARPWTSWSSWTANSTSRSPPEPSLIWRSASWAGMWSTTRRRIAWTSATKPSRSAALHTIGSIISR